MKIVFRLALLAGVAVLGFWLWTVLFPSPEKVVLRKIAELAANATFNADASSLARAAKAGNLVDFFAPDAQIILDAPGVAAHTFSGRDEIREAALAGLATLNSLKVKFLDTTVQISADKQSADVSCTVEVNAGDNKDYGAQEMHFRFQKIDGNWLIARAETVKTLS